MIHYEGSVLNQYDDSATGNAAANSTVTVRKSLTGEKPQLYSDDGITPIDNPVTSANDGSFDFWVSAGSYTLIYNEGKLNEKRLEKVGIFDGNGTSLRTETELKDSSFLQGSLVKLQDRADAPFEINPVGSTVNFGDILLNNGTVAKLLVTTGGYNIKWFGAKGDNSTNDYAAIQGAISYIESLGAYSRPSLYFPAGAYKINQTVRITKPIKIYGDGMQESYIVGINTGGSYDLFSLQRSGSLEGYYFFGEDTCYIKDMAFAHNGNNTGGSCIELATRASASDQTWWAHIEGCSMVAAPDYGFRQAPQSGNFLIERCTVKGNRTNLRLEGVDGTIQNCEVASSKEDNISFNGATNIWINATKFFFAGRYNVFHFYNQPNNGGEVRFVNCQIDGAVEHNIYDDVRYHCPRFYISCDIVRAGRTSAAGVYSHIYKTTNSKTGMLLDDVNFGPTDEFGGEEAEYWINFNGSAESIMVGSIMAQVGELNDYPNSLTNRKDKILTFGSFGDAYNQATLEGFINEVDYVRSTNGACIRMLHKSYSTSVAAMALNVNNDGTGSITSPSGVLVKLRGPYADDAAAGAAGVTIGYSYYKPTGEVVVRIA